MALDEPDDEDETQKVGGITFCMTKDLYQMIGEVSVGLSYMGFTISSESPYSASAPQGHGCSGCSGDSCSI